MEYPEALGNVESGLCHNIHDVEQYIMSFTNYVHYVNGQWAYVVYIHGKPENKVTGYHLYVQAIDGSSHTLTPYIYPIQGVLEVVKTVTLHMASICNPNLGIQHTVVNNPRLVFENYVKEMETFENYGCSYQDHITNIIDSIIQCDDHITDNHHIDPLYMSTKTLQASPELVYDASLDRLPITHNKCNTNSRLDNRTSSDFNCPDKKIGFINLEATAFSFIGPDRESIEIDSSDKLVKIADTILSTGVPNY